MCVTLALDDSPMVGCVVVYAVIRHVKATRPVETLEKLVSIHALNLVGTRCDVLRRCLLLVCDILWYVCIVRGRE